MYGDGSDSLSLNSSYNSYISSFLGSKTQSRRRRTTNGRMIRPYSDGLNFPRSMSSAADQMRDDRLEV